MITETLAGETDLAGFRAAARRLVAVGVSPDAVDWVVVGRAEGGLFDAQPEPAGAAEAPPPPSTAAALRVPPAFVELCRSAVLHSSRQRFHLLYRLLWRLQHERALRDDPLDADWAQAALWAQAVRRDQHKMKAFVRFREIAARPDEPAAAPLHVAWFEPQHHIVEAVAPFFMRRFAAMRWAILTPARSVRWDGTALVFGPGAGRDQAPPPDAGEALWLTYYANIFNPARLKLRAMEKEMPRRYWADLPEARLISGLTAAAAERSGRMIEREPQPTQRRLPPPPVVSRAPNPAPDGSPEETP